MSLSEKIKSTKFSKSVAGYSQKEVDAFLESTAAVSGELEQKISVLRTKLDAYESRADEIKKLENEAKRLLEGARCEARQIVLAAQKNAEEILAKANDDANAILATADKNGKAIVSAANAEADEIARKSAAIVKECEDFEAQFRNTVASTVKKLSALRSGAPKITVTETPAVEEPKKSEPKAVRETAKRKPYDTLTVVYDTDDDFADIQKIKSEAGERKIKNPTEF